MKAPYLYLVTILVPILFLGCTAETVVTTGIVAENAKNQAQALQGVTGQAGQQIGLSQVRQAIAVFQAENGRWPSSLDELVTYGYLYSIPQLPDGKQFMYNNVTGQVTVARVQYPAAPGYPQQPIAPQQQVPQTSRRMGGYGGSPYMQQFQVQHEFQYGNQAHYGGAASAQTGSKSQLQRIHRDYNRRQNQYLNQYGF